MNVRVNLLCIVGALVGATSASLPWFRTYSVFGNHAYMPLDVLSPMLGFDFYHDSMIFWAFFLFLLGVLVAVISPLGALVQITGISLFFWGYARIYGQWPPDFEDTLSLGCAPYVGILSASIILASLVGPAGPCRTSATNALERLLTITPSRWTRKVPAAAACSPNLSVWSVCFALALVGGIEAVIYGVMAPGMDAGASSDMHSRALDLLVVCGSSSAVFGAGSLLAVFARRSHQSPPGFQPPAEDDSRRV